ncbi:MAG TPA: hypothetical protein VFB80_15020 [Pirellulaceae bacterium]|nr:hypothetical protein [Pirellulaceae bacterium]
MLPTKWLTRLEERTLPHFNQLVIWLLLATAMVLAVWRFEIRTGERSGFVSLLSWLPDSVVASPATWLACRGLLIAGIVLWALNRWLPWSCWLTVAGFTCVWSLHVETTYNTAHIFHMANMLLVIQALWITGDARLIRERIAAGTFWQTPLVPRWVSLASIAYIGIFHTAAGLSKLLYSGPQWATGTSLQLWTYLWGRPWSPTTQFLLSSRSFTRGLQVLTLVVESSGILAIFPRLRTWIGLALLAFYAGVLATFDYGFQFNAMLTAIYFLPLESWITRWARKHQPSRAT